METKSIIFLCTGNSCRSQMAEAIARKIFPDNWSVYSAGTQVHGLNPKALVSIKKFGYKTDALYSKNIDDMKALNFDLAMSVCDSAQSSCPYLEAKTNIHHSFDDPPKLSANLVDLEAQVIFDRVFLEIEAYLKELKSDLNN